MLMKKDGTFKRCGFLECADCDSMQVSCNYTFCTVFLGKHHCTVAKEENELQVEDCKVFI